MTNKLETIGWILFTLGSFIFLIDNIIQMNIISAIGSAIFFIACIVFMLSRR